ncbi:MAG: hypothetical protein COB71_08570 [Thiotrichales bacterium]|nr:MAG: hypothetical protein COB71_08570 [Thiotrichales bacterium]
MKYGISYGLIAALVLVPGSSIAGPVNQSLLNSDEIKHVRHLSRALLKNRAIEKKKIVGELITQRKQLEIMSAALSAAEVDIRRSMFAAELVLNKNNSDVAISLDNNVSNNGGTKETDNIKTVKTDSKSKAIEKKRGIIKRAIDEINNTSQEISVSALLSSGEDLKGNQSRARRSKQMRSVIKGVVNELAVMSDRGVVDVKKIKDLKEKLMLKKNKISIDDISPTLSTRTRHRR